MKLKWTFLAVFVLLSLSSAQARAAAVVAVMPVQGVNLSEGQCDVIGLLFADAFARETRAAVTPPAETKPMLAQGKTPLAVATQLGVLEYIELRALQLGARVTVAGIRRGKDGAELFRAETAASSLDEMEIAVARLARSLAWRQPMPGAARMMPVPEAAGTVPALPEPSGQYPKAFGMKTGLIFPYSSGRSFAPLMSAQFDGRMGSRDSFIEFGVGAAIPSTSSDGSNTIEMGGVFVELGGSFYLSDGPVAPYLGAGVSPRIWIADAPNVSDSSGGTCVVYGQAGINFTRDSRARVYAEFRVNQYILGLRNRVSTLDGTITNGTYHPTEFALQLGIGW